MAKYNIRITASAEKSLKSVPGNYAKKIVKAIQLLADDPFPQGSRKLAGYDDSFRIRVGNYRVIYSIDKMIITIIILKIGHRKEVYRH
jgi:mRNA interferase RelE/StbE